MIKPQFSIRTTLFVIISVLNILVAVLAGTGVYSSWVRLQQAQELTQGSVSLNLLYRAQRYLSLERGASLPVLYIEGPVAETLQEEIVIDRKSADTLLNDGIERIKNTAHTKDFSSLLSQIREKQSSLQELRKELDANMKKPIDVRNQQLSDELFDANTDLIMAIRDLTIAYSRPLLSIDAVVNQQLIFKHTIWEITEYAGREYATIGGLIARNKQLTLEKQEQLLMWRALIQHGWAAAHQLVLSSGLNKKLASYIDEAETHYFLTFDQIKNIFYMPSSPSEDPQYPLTTEMWLGLASEAVDSLLSLKDASLQETQTYVDKIELEAEHGIIINIFLFFCAAAISLYCFAVIVWRVTRPVDFMVNALYRTSQGLPHDPLPVIRRNDEIGKLATVLKALQDNSKKLKQSNEELERYAYIASHDLKSPLRAIDHLSQWLEEDLEGVLTDQAREHINNLRQRVRRMEKLLNDTLEYSRIGHQTAADNKKVNGKTLVEDAVFMASPPKSFTIKIDDRFKDIHLDRMPLEQIFYNLINNAIKHHESEAGVIQIGVDEDESHYIFSVRDDGPGIDPKYHQRIFEMFQTLKPRDQREGSGMGLAIVRKILKTRDCDITLESDLGHGATFRFTWPKKERGIDDV